MMKYSTYYFDFNGTIIDDVKLCLDLLNKMLKEKKIPTVDIKKYKEIFTFPIIEYYKLAGFDFSKDYSFQDLAIEFINDYQEESLKCNLYQGIKEVLKYLKENNATLICLSASEINNLKEQLTHFGIIDYFDFVLGIDNIHAKGKSDIALEFLKQNPKYANDALLIGDTIHDYEVAKIMGIDALLVASGHQSKERLKKYSNLVIDDINQIYDIILPNSEFIRTEVLFKNNEIKGLYNKKVLVFGIGGVGGYVIEMLARIGIQNIDIVDYDVVTKSNINRQIIADYETINLDKTFVMKERLKRINPNINCEAINIKVNEETIKTFDFSKYNYIIDCIDDIKAKLLIIEKAKDENINIISAMGAGNKITTNYLVTDINKTEMCPLAKKIRLELRKRNINKLNVCFSKDLIIENNSGVIGSIVFSVMAMAIKIVEFVVKDILTRKESLNE